MRSTSFRTALLLACTVQLAGCGDASRTPPTAPEGNLPRLVVDGRPSAVLIEVIGPGVRGITGSAEYTRSSQSGDTLMVLFAGTNLTGSLATLDLDASTSVSQLQVRVVEAVDSQDQPMTMGSVTARIQVAAK